MAGVSGSRMAESQPVSPSIYPRSVLIVAVVFNAVALRMVLLTETRGAVFDPVCNSLLHILAYFVSLMLLGFGARRFYCIYCSVVAAGMMYVGVFKPAMRWMAIGDPNHAFAITAYPGSILIHFFSAQVYILSMLPLYRADKKAVWQLVQVLGGVGVVLVAILYPYGGLSLGAACNDAAEFPTADYRPTHRPWHSMSFYVPMRDGVKLAVDVHLPSGWRLNSKDSELATVIMMTRYIRRYLVRFPWSYIGMFGDVPRRTFSTAFARYLFRLLPAGYAVVGVDVRGTGASFGNRTVDLSSLEVGDYEEIFEWVKLQPWYNGHVGVAGTSYDGLAATLLSSKGGIDAAAILSSPMDFQDVLVPGGILSTAFLDIYQPLTSALERGQVPRQEDLAQTFGFHFFLKYVLGGVSPVDGYTDTLPYAIDQHLANYNLRQHAKHQFVRGFPDDIIADDNGVEIPATSVGVTPQVLDQLAQSNTSVALFSGYWDHASVRSALRVHRALKGKRVQATFGPWAHGAFSCFTPQSAGYKVKYPLFEQLTAFFDCQLKGKCSGQEAIRYYQIGEEKWVLSDTFPPTNSEWFSLHLSATRGLVQSTQQEDTGTVLYTVTNTSTTGYASRWNLIGHIMGHPVPYSNRLEQSDDVLAFTSQPLTSSVRMVGSPQLNLTLEAHEPADSENMVVFAYLEDVDPLAGRIHYVTEAVLRVGHGVVKRNTQVGAWDGVEHSLSEKDFQPVSGAVTIELAMEPIAYTFLPGHEIRLSIAGADTDNFDFSYLKKMASVWKVHLGSAVLRLPVS